MSRVLLMSEIGFAVMVLSHRIIPRLVTLDFMHLAQRVTPTKLRLRWNED